MTAWKVGDIKNMKKCFDRGMSVKSIAKELGRSPSAVNKALTRFSIRPTRVEQKKKDFYEHSHCVQKLAKASEKAKRILPGQSLTNLLLRPIPSLARQISHAHRAYLQRNGNARRVWRDIKTVVMTLREKGHIVFPLNAQCSYEIDCDYSFDQSIYKARDLVILLNSYRLKNNQLPLYVKGVTEHE